MLGVNDTVIGGNRGKTGHENLRLNIPMMTTADQPSASGHQPPKSPSMANNNSPARRYSEASGKKLIAVPRRSVQSTSHGPSKSATLPRIAGGSPKQLPVAHKQRIPITPPIYRRQVSDNLAPNSANNSPNITNKVCFFIGI